MAPFHPTGVLRQNPSEALPRCSGSRARVPHPIRRVHSPDERTESQSRSRSRRTFVFGWMQSGNQLNVVPDLFGGKRTGPLIAACDLRRQRAEGTARAGIVAVSFVQIVIDQLCER